MFETLAIALVSVYLALSFIKFCLMLGTLPAAVGTYYRVAEGKISRAQLASMLILVNLYICLVGSLHALRREKYRFFSVYSNFGTMRDILRNFRSN